MNYRSQVRSVGAMQMEHVIARHEEVELQLDTKLCIKMHWQESQYHHKHIRYVIPNYQNVLFGLQFL